MESLKAAGYSRLLVQIPAGHAAGRDGAAFFGCGMQFRGSGWSLFHASAGGIFPVFSSGGCLPGSDALSRPHRQLDGLWMGVPSVTMAAGIGRRPRRGRASWQRAACRDSIARTRPGNMSPSRPLCGQLQRLREIRAICCGIAVFVSADGWPAVCRGRGSGVSADVEPLSDRMIRVEPARIRFGDFLSPRQEFKQIHQAKVTVECCVPLRRRGHRQRIVDGHARY